MIVRIILALFLICISPLNAVADESVLELLKGAEAMLDDDPAGAASIFDKAVTLVPAMPSAQMPDALRIIEKILSDINNPAFQENHAESAATIYSATLRIASNPAVLAYAPDLYANTLITANSFVETNPNVSTDFKETVLMAQTPATMPPPRATPAGVLAPSAE